MQNVGQTHSSKHAYRRALALADELHEVIVNAVPPSEASQADRLLGAIAAELVDRLNQINAERRT